MRGAFRHPKSSMFVLQALRVRPSIARRALTPEPTATSLASGIASSSRLRLSDSFRQDCLSYTTWKGKEKASSYLDRLAQPLGRARCSHMVTTTNRRSFHTSARRDALPLIPATIAVLKTGSALTIITTISRILVSFLPLGTIATFKFSRGVRWLERDSQVPVASAESEEFWKMWCEGEKGIRLKKGEAEKFIDGQVDEYGGLVSSDGRSAYPMPLAPSRDGPRSNRYAISKMREREMSDERILKIISSRWFVLPSLPPASIRYYNELSIDEQKQVDALRRYWMSLRMFKDTLKYGRWFVSALIGIPVVLFLGVIMCGMEKVPLTGRSRLILLTPEEEDAISSSLAGANWYRSVINLLTTAEKPAPPIISYDDWRWKWVQSVLTQLETGVLRECDLHGIEPQILVDQSKLLPPPASHPLKPRPRLSSALHGALPGSEKSSGKEHLELGPPYSLMILDKNDKNAFSYGFGGKGAGGVVVFTGLLDDILKSCPAQIEETPRQTGFFGSIFSSPPPPRRRNPQPTEEETLHLACVLAHEMGHLLLSHHLETLSQQQVFWPAMLGLSMDLLRAFIWPFTIFLGPTVNDALANVGRTSAEVVADKYGEIGFQWKHEYEADLAGLRLLALAGFDPHKAVNHFAISVADLHEIQSPDRSDTSWSGRLLKLWTTTTHPAPEKRVLALQEELQRWKEYKAAKLAPAT